jgi:hypothetical protein
MSSIIRLRFGTVTKRPSVDLSELLAAGTEAVNTSSLAMERAAPVARDWTNQEMADLARVQYLLSCAGVPLETDRGLSDEGDPWFVFCDSQGEVFVHICRMGMTYLLDGPSLEAPLRGPSFVSLVKKFVDHATARVAAFSVVPLDKGNKVFLHPSMMLAALIWSLFLMTDQMTNAAYAVSFDGAGEGSTDPADFDVETAFGLLADVLKDSGNNFDRLIATKAVGKDGLLIAPSGISDKASASQGFFNPTVFSGLSAIALAFGLLQPVESRAASTDALEETQASVQERTSVLTLAAPVDERRAYKSDAQSSEDHQHQDGETQSWTHTAQSVHLPEINRHVGLVFPNVLDIPAAGSDWLGAFGHEAVSPVHSASVTSPIAIALSQSPSRGGTSTKTDVMPSKASEHGSRDSTPAAANAGDMAANAIATVSFEALATHIIKSAEGLIVVHSTLDPVVASAELLGHFHESLLRNLGDSTSVALQTILKLEGAMGEAATYNLGESLKDGELTGQILSPDDGPTTITSGGGYLPPNGAAGTGLTEVTKGTNVAALTTFTVAADKASDVKADVITTGAPVPVSSALVAAGNSYTANLSVTASTKFGSYSDAARNLVDFLLAKQKDIIVVKFANEIVILDKTALDEATDIAYAHSWSVAGGGTVSTVGHYVDYKDFGLI